MATTIEGLDQAVKNLRTIGKGLRKRQLQAPLRKAAKILLDEGRQNIPKSDQKHSRYSTPKVVGKMRAPKGLGRIVATYFPGNLQRALNILTFRRSQNVFVGFKVAKQDPKGTFMGRRVDGYYAVMRLEIGEAPLRRAVDATKRRVGEKAVEEINILIEKILSQIKT